MASSQDLSYADDDSTATINTETNKRPLETTPPPEDDPPSPEVSPPESNIPEITWVETPSRRALAYPFPLSTDPEYPDEPLFFVVVGTVQNYFLDTQGQYGHSLTIKTNDATIDYIDSLTMSSPHREQAQTFRLPVTNGTTLAIKCLDCLAPKKQEEMCTLSENGPFQSVWDASVFRNSFLGRHLSGGVLPAPGRRRTIPASKITRGSNVVVEILVSSWFIAGNGQGGCKLGLYTIGLMDKPNVVFVPKRPRHSAMS
jgi:hypothetical protein